MKYLIIILSMLSMGVFAQKTIDERTSSWNSVIINYHLNNKFSIVNEAHFRRTNFLKDWQQILIRPSVHYKLNESVGFSGGYSYAKNYKTAYNFNENNVWQQLLLKHNSGKSHFSHRFRFEQRFIDHIVSQDNSNFVKEGTNFITRFRYRFTWRMPLFKVEENKAINITVFDEIFLNTGTGVLPESLNFNWISLGLSYPIFKNASLSIAYVYDSFPVSKNQFKINNIFQTILIYHIK